MNDMRRGESIYEIDPSVAEEVETGIENQGSNLSGVSAKISWSCDSAPEALTQKVSKTAIKSGFK